MSGRLTAFRSVGICVLLSTGLTWAAGHNFDGTWRMDSAASEFKGNTVYARRTIVFKSIRRGLWMRSTGVAPSGAVQAGEYTARLDGRYYPVTGNIGPDEIALTKPSSTVITFVNRKEGRVLATGYYEISADGFKLTLVTERDAPAGKTVTMRAVFFRQR